jgi:hypothetical protein
LLRFIWAPLILASLFTTPPARACGVSADGVSSCNLDEHDEDTRPHWRLGASGLYTSTALRFDGSLRGDETRLATLATAAYLPSRRVALQVGLGAALGGELAMPDGAHTFSPGPVAAIGASWRVVDARPFVFLTSVLSFSAATTRSPVDTGTTGYEAFDLRLGALVGTTIADVLSPFLVTRVFGGPVFWRYEGRAVTGTDTSHFQVGAGFTLAIARRVDAFAEGIALGERAVGAGLAVGF